MTRPICKGLLAAAILSLALAGTTTSSFAAKKKMAKTSPCMAGQLCTPACKPGQLCNIQVCGGGGQLTPSGGFCVEGSIFCPPKC